jgi:hypothetical protein
MKSQVNQETEKDTEETPAPVLFSPIVIDVDMTWLPINQHNKSGKE